MAMTEKDIRKAVRCLADGLIEIDKEGFESLSPEQKQVAHGLLDAGYDLMSNFLVNQNRIAEALERIALLRERS